jgi:hypothetical protein
MSPRPRLFRNPGSSPHSRQKRQTSVQQSSNLNDDAETIATWMVKSYPTVPASDAKTYVTLLVGLLRHYPNSGWLMDPFDGVQAKYKHCPKIAELKEFLDERSNQAATTQRLTSSWGLQSRQIAEEWPEYQGWADNSTTSALCRRFGLSAIPVGWDAVEVTRLAARHGAAFPQFVERVLAAERLPSGPTHTAEPLHAGPIPISEALKTSVIVQRIPTREAAE